MDSRCRENDKVMGLGKIEKTFLKKVIPALTPSLILLLVCWNRGRWPITNRSFQQARLLGFCVWSMQFLKRRPGTSSLRWKSGFMGWLRSRGMSVMAFLSGRLNVDGNGRCKGRGGAFSLAVFFIKTCFGKGQNVPSTSPTLLRNEWRVFVLARLGWFALTAGLRCKPPARARGISPGSLFAHWEILCWSLPRSEKRPRIISRPHGAQGEARQRECELRECKQTKRNTILKPTLHLAPSPARHIFEFYLCWFLANLER